MAPVGEILSEGSNEQQTGTDAEGIGHHVTQTERSRWHEMLQAFNQARVDKQ